MIKRGVRPLQLADRQVGMGRAAERIEILNAQPRLPATLDYLLLLNFDCAGGGRPTFFAGIRQVAQVRIV